MRSQCGKQNKEMTHKTRKLPYLIDRLISPGVNMTIIPSVNMILMMKFNCEKNDFKF